MTDRNALKPLGPAFHAAMRGRLRRTAAESGLDGHLLLRPSNIAYGSGFFFSPNERPVGLFIDAAGDTVLFVPDLERENAAENGLDDIRCYDEFPGETHPVLWMLSEIGVKRIAIDALDAALLDLARDKVSDIELRDFAAELRCRKTVEELRLVREAARFADMFLLHFLRNGADILAQGGGERELLDVCMSHAKHALFDLHGAAFAGTPVGITATVHSGPRAALPHGAVTERQPRHGETIIAGIGAHLGGYHAESGATFVYGEASREQRAVMVAMQACNDAAIAALRPGETCEDVNEAAMKALREAGLGDAIRHRIGHGMGLDGHEAPWLAPGDGMRIAPHMVFSNEPGVYRPGRDGYRTINTMIVTDTGVEVSSRFQAETPFDDRVLAA